MSISSIKHETLTDYRLIQIYVNRIKKKTIFTFKTRDYLNLWTPEKLKVLTNKSFCQLSENSPPKKIFFEKSIKKSIESRDQVFFKCYLLLKIWAQILVKI